MSRLRGAGELRHYIMLVGLAFSLVQCAIGLVLSQVARRRRERSER